MGQTLEPRLPPLILDVALENLLRHTLFERYRVERVAVELPGVQADAVSERETERE